MERLLYLLARSLVAVLQSVSLPTAGRVGRVCGALVHLCDRRHRRVAIANLTRCFGQEKSPEEIRKVARENFKRIGESFACAIKTASMSLEELQPHVEFVGPDHLKSPPPDRPPASVVIAVGHFGNFELYARFSQYCPAFQCATTYRALPQPSLNDLLQSLRERSGCRFFERRFDGAALRTFMNQPGVMLGLLGDQDGGDRGVHVPFLGHDCSTSPAPAIFALRYHCALHVAVCYRTGLGRWRIVGGEEIPTLEAGQPRSASDIMRDVNRAFEEAVRKDPANWFWVHNRWKRGRAQVGNDSSAVSRDGEVSAPARSGSPKL